MTYEPSDAMVDAAAGYIHAQTDATKETAIRVARAALRAAFAAAKDRPALWQLLLERDEMGERPDTNGCDLKCKTCDCGLREWEEQHRGWQERYRALKDKQP